MQPQQNQPTPSSHNEEKQWRPPKQFANYLLEKEIDGGGMGIIYKAYTISDQRPVAIKFLIEKTQYKRFQREVDTGKRLNHPNFVRCHDTGEIEGHFFIVMDFIDGQPLKKYMEKVNLSSDKRLELFFTIVSAIAYAHEQGIIHRDLKPANILIDQKEEPIILDFGLAKYIEMPEKNDATALTIEGQILGTPGYMSPEQARGEVEKQDARSDIFSLGIILYEMLTARNPFDGANFLEICYNIAHKSPIPIEKILPGIPPQLAYICNKALSKEKESRYQTAREFADDIKSYTLIRKNAKDHPTLVYETGQASSFQRAPSDDDQPIDLANVPVERVKKLDKIICTYCGALNVSSNIQCQSCGKSIRKSNIYAKYNITPPEGLPAVDVLAMKGKPALKMGASRPRPGIPPKNPMAKMPLASPIDYKGPILLTPDKEVKETGNPKPGKGGVLFGALTVPIAMLPIVRHLAIPFYSLIFELLLGGLCQYFIKKYRGGAIIGGVVLLLACLVSFFLKYLFSWVPHPFSPGSFGNLFLGISLMVLLGINLGLLEKYKLKSIHTPDSE